MVVCPSMLITDDDRDFRETIRDVFEPRGFQTHLASNGEEAIEIVSRTEIHLVLMDMHMPRLSGIEAIARIKKLRSQLPCILLSGELDDQIRAAATEAFRVLAKPITVEKITSTVASAIQATYNWSDFRL